MADPAISALNALLRSASIQDHDEALSRADAALKASKPGGPERLTAGHTKVVALLKLDRFDDALRALADEGTALENACVLEKAYALYKTGQLAEAAALCSGGNAARALGHVGAQVAYRAEDFSRAADVYEQLARRVEAEGKPGEEPDMRVNYLAMCAQLEWQGRGSRVPEKERQPSRDDMEAFETAYNAACACLGRGDFARAIVLLKRSKDLCEASEDLSDEEKAAEILPIAVQQVYALTQLGKLDEAAALQNSLQLSEIPDGSTKLIIQANSLVLQAEKNPYVAQRNAQALKAPEGSDRLFEYQAAILQRSSSAIELQCQKFSGFRSKASRQLGKAAEASSRTSPRAVGLGVLGAAAQAELKTGKEALERILPLLDSRPDDVGLLLTIIQLYIQTRNPMPAVTLLEAFFRRLEAATTPDHADVRFAPGLVAVAVALYKLQGRQRAIRAELARAAAHWQRRPGDASTSLLHEAGLELLRSSDPDDLAAAGSTYTRLSEANPDDRAAKAGLVASFATTDFDAIEQHLSSLAPVDQLTKSIDVDALIDAGVAALPVASTAAAAAAAPPTARKKRPAESAMDPAQPQKKKRQRKLPKDYDPDRKMDPERWLPLRDRSSYRPKGKKGKRRAAEATQGGVVKEEETLELAGGAGSVKVERAPQGGGGAGAAGAKKKKKGKK